MKYETDNIVRWNDPAINNYPKKDRKKILNRRFRITGIRGEIYILEEINADGTAACIGSVVEALKGELEPADRQKDAEVHFCRLDNLGKTGSVLVTLPNQTLGKRKKISVSDCFVKADRGSESAFQRIRKKYPAGTIFYTTTLRTIRGTRPQYLAKDMVPVDETTPKDIQEKLQKIA